ncbi:Hypothetical protein LUCI_3752 [Lucifera butyrica]|uniref:Helix-turn-helix domain-containing protein n=1 Tax=Lucifera butyrica TaxID=1351585 RepID=A0A498R6U2_9FIRM|nr:helix-turn-helix domain-containing protein [Lucifera butyrica]VBB08446.1 Hypothetical protein LUCI_3718 [Lucifera butyrica]VBB08480.1 Hypothetical protein LUCI_3752 [Lucifera butyrica]
MKDHYNIKQAAEVIGVSTKTVRKRIQSGELPAVWEDRGKGMSQWWIPMGAVQAAATTLEAIPVTRHLSPVEVAQMIQNAVREAVQQELENFREDMEIRSDQRDKKLMEAIRAIQEERRNQSAKPWWKKMLKS